MGQVGSQMPKHTVYSPDSTYKDAPSHPFNVSLLSLDWQGESPDTHQNRHELAVKQR